jgi:hypothetical protein
MLPLAAAALVEVPASCFDTVRGGFENRRQLDAPPRALVEFDISGD